MRVVHVCPRYGPVIGGAELFLAKLGAALKARGADVEVWTTTARTVAGFTGAEGDQFASGSDSHEGIPIRRYRPAAVPLRRYLLTAAQWLPLGSGWRSSTLRWNPIVPAMIRDARRARQPIDVVHASGLPYGSLLLAGLRLAEATGARLAMTPFLHVGAGGSVGGRVRRAYLAPANVALLSRADAVLVQTEGEGDALAAAGVRSDRLHLIGMGVDPADCTGGDRVRGRTRWGLGPDAVVVGHLANKSDDKGTTALLDAARTLWDRGEAREMRLLVAGSEMGSFARAWASFPAKERVVNLGPLDDAEVRDFYAAIDLFALPSHVESFGISILEAACNGVASIALDAGGPSAIIEDGRTGLLVPPARPAGLVEALARVADDTALRDSLGTAARAAATSWTWTRTTDRVIEVFDRVGVRSCIPAKRTT